MSSLLLITACGILLLGVGVVKVGMLRLLEGDVIAMATSPKPCPERSEGALRLPRFARNDRERPIANPRVYSFDFVL